MSPEQREKRRWADRVTPFTEEQVGVMFPSNTIQGLAPVHTLHFNKEGEGHSQQLLQLCGQHPASFGGTLRHRCLC